MSTVMAKAPEKDAVYKLISESYTLNTDGSTEFRKRTELQIFTRMTFDHFGETFITYNPDFQELIINEAYTIRKDGSKVETPKNAFNPMLPEGCTKCERLNGVRTMVVTHTALEYDAIIVLDYTIRSKNFFFRELWEKVDLQEEVPVEKYVISVTHRSGGDLKIVFNGNCTHTVNDGENVTTHEFTYTNLPECPTDEYLFPDATAWLAFTTVITEGSLIDEISRQNSMQKFDNQKITDFFRGRFTGDMSDMDKILYVRDYIHDNIRTSNLNAKVLNYMFASPQQVWESNCALPIEKNILLAGVLQSLGYDAQLAFQFDTSVTDLKGVVRIHRDGVPQTDLKTVVRIHRDGVSQYISANEIEKLSLDAFFAPATLILLDGEIEKVEAEPTSVERVTEIIIEDGKLDDPTVKMQLQNIKSPQMLYLDVHGRGITKAYVSQLSGKYYELTIDDGNYGTQIQSVNIHNDRQYNVNTRQSDEKYAYTVKLPANVRCLTKQVHKEITVENAKLLIDVQVDGQTVKITRQLSLPQEGISAKSVKKFKAMMGEWEAPVKVVFSTL